MEKNYSSFLCLGTAQSSSRNLVSALYRDDFVVIPLCSSSSECVERWCQYLMGVIALILFPLLNAVLISIRSAGANSRMKSGLQREMDDPGAPCLGAQHPWHLLKKIQLSICQALCKCSADTCGCVSSNICLTTTVFWVFLTVFSGVNNTPIHLSSCFFFSF